MDISSTDKAEATAAVAEAAVSVTATKGDAKGYPKGRGKGPPPPPPKAKVPVTMSEDDMASKELRSKAPVIPAVATNSGGVSRTLNQLMVKHLAKAAAVPKEAYGEKQRLRREAEVRRLEELREKQREDSQRRDELRARLHTLQSQSIDSVPWSSAVQTVHLEGGGSRGGVTVFELQSGSAVCLRQSLTLASELVAWTVARVLGTPIAACRLVQPGSAEYKEILEAERRLMPLEGRAPPFAPAARAAAWVPPERVSLLAVLQFVPGFRLDTARRFLEDPSAELLKNCGEMQALDLLLNNVDRFPLPVWRAPRGNFGNVMVSVSGRTAVGIDQQVFVISDATGALEQHLSDVKSLLGELFAAAGEQEGRATDDERPVDGDASGATKFSLVCVQKRYRKCFHDRLGVHLEEASTTQILDGLRVGLQGVAAAWRDGRLESALVEAEAAVCEAIRDSPKNALNADTEARAGIAFVKRVAAAISSVVPSAT